MSQQKIGALALEKRGWWATRRWLVLRRLSQISILIFFMLGPWFDLWFIKGNLSSSLLLDTVPMTDPLLFLQILAAGFFGVASAAAWGAAIILIFYMLVGGRVFCSWVCPVNLVTDFAFWLRQKLGIKGGLMFPRNTRYWVLAVVMIVAAITGSLAYELINPVSLFHRGIFYGMGTGWVLIIGLLLFDLAVSNRGWCSHLCPMGAFYALISRLSIIRVKAQARTACDDCGDCFVICPEPQILPPVLKGEKTGVPPIVLDNVCTNCGRCIDICHASVFDFGNRYSKTDSHASNEAMFQQVNAK